MVVKKQKPVFKEPVIISELINVDLDAHPRLRRFVQPSSLPNQLDALREFNRDLESSSDGDVRDWVAALTAVFFSAPAKHQIRRAIASCLKTVPESTQDLTIQMFSTALQDLINTLPESHLADSHRMCVDTVSALLENFPLGESSLLRCAQETLTCFTCYLSLLLKAISKSESPVERTSRVQDCHVTVQVTAKLLHRLLDRDTCCVTSQVIQELSQTLHSVICNDLVMLDCQAASSMCLILLLKLQPLPNLPIHSLLYSSFTTHNHVLTPTHPCWRASLKLTSLPPHSALCFINGTLAMMSTDDLCAEVTEGHSLMEVIAVKVISLADGALRDSSAKLMASKTLVLWTSRACQLLSGSSKAVSSRLKAALSGSATVPQQLMHHAWTHWEHPVDALRHQARSLFENLVQCHLLATKESASSSDFVLSLCKSVLALDWNSKGKYGALTCLVGHIGVKVILELCPDLATILLTSMSDQTLACYVSELYEKLFTTHQREAGHSAGHSPGGSVRQWVEPTLHTLCTGPVLARTYVTEYILPKLLKKEPTCLSFIITTLSAYERRDVGALITCLKLARSLGLVRGEAGQSGVWRGVLSVDVLKAALRHQHEQVRLDALGLLCEHNKTTELVSSYDLDLVMYALPSDLSSQSPAFRQHLTSILTKLFVRLRESSRTLSSGTNNKNQQLQHYQVFISGLCSLCFSSLHPGAGFPQRTTVLSLLSALFHSVTQTSNPDSPSLCGVAINMIITPTRLHTLLSSLVDTFEDNKRQILSILSSLPRTLYKDLSIPWADLTTIALDLVKTTRPQDCTTAAYLLKAWLCIQSPASSIQAPPTSTEPRRAFVFNILMSELQDQVELVHSKGLLHGAATRPMYPVLHCIRHLVENTQLSALGGDSWWKDWVARLVDLCFTVASVVSPVVSNSSPEGNVPEDAVIGPGLALEALTEDGLPSEVSESASRVSLMPEYLIVCSWRSIKEVSLLLGLLSTSSPLSSPSSPGLLSLQQVLSIGAFFTSQLLESRHRGAFELAYAGFTMMTERLWRCEWDELHHLPSLWLEEVMSDVRVCHSVNRLCATRRSAGVPFYIQAIVSTEPASTGRKCLQQTMTELLKLALPSEATPTDETRIEDTPSEATPTEATPTDATPTEDTPTKTTPIEETPTVAMPTETTPTDAMPTEATPTEATPTEDMPTEATPTKVTPIDATPTEATPTKNTPTEAMPTGDTPTEATPTEATPTGTTPTEATTIEDTPTEATPTDDTPTEATPTEATPIASSDNIPRVHALNILRALFRDSRLSSDIMPFVAKGMKCALLGYTAQLWEVRNASSLLFSALMSRIFGVKRSKDELSRKNLMTGRVFFTRFPDLYTLLLSTLTEATTQCDTAPHSGLYPVLLVLGRLYPSVIEGADCDLNLATFIPLVIKCAGSVVYKTRIMAARAIRPLVARDQLLPTLTHLFTHLPTHPHTHASQNLIHGLLLQVSHLISDLHHLPRPSQIEVTSLLLSALHARLWLADRCNPCYLTRTVFIEVCLSLLKISWSGEDCMTLLSMQQSLAGKLMDIITCQVVITSQPLTTWIPYFSQHQETIADLILTISSCELTDHSTYVPTDSTSDIILSLLQSPCYEVRHKTLDFLLSCVSPCSQYSEEHPSPTRPMCLTERSCDRVRSLLDDRLCEVLCTSVMSPDQLPDDITKALELLRHMAQVNQPWTCQQKTFTQIEVMSRLSELQDHNRDEVCCAALSLTAHLLPGFLSPANQSQAGVKLVRLWCERLVEHCTPQCSVERRMTCAQLLNDQATLLLGSNSLLEQSVLWCWRCLILLLHDEDQEVRLVSAQCASSLHHSQPHTEWCGVVASVAVDLCLGALIEAHSDLLLPLLETLITWILHPLHADWNTEERAVRLFDKGEINTYHDELHFAHQVSKHLKGLLTSLTTNADVTLPWRSFVDNALRTLLGNLEESVQTLDVLSCDAAFLWQRQYEEGVRLAARRVMLGECLVIGSESEEAKKCQELVDNLKVKLNYELLM